MNGWLVLAIVVGIVALGIVAQRLGWIDLSNKTRSGGGGGGLVGGIDEVFHPAAYNARQEIDRQEIVPAPAPIPGDGDKGIIEPPKNSPADEDRRYAGRMRIDLGEDQGPSRD